jgi:hypothetical protein
MVSSYDDCRSESEEYEEDEEIEGEIEDSEAEASFTLRTAQEAAQILYHQQRRRPKKPYNLVELTDMDEKQ